MDLAATLSWRFNIPLTDDLDIYLGIPVVHGRIIQKLLQFIVAKVQRKLGGLKKKCLSRAAKLIQKP